MPIKLENIKKSFEGKTVIDNLSLEIQDKGIFGIFGNSGKGKTTLLRLICGLEKLDGGKITGTEGKRFSVVFQEDRLLPWYTALENVEAVSNRETALRNLSAVGLEEEADKMPSQLSGGMKRRVAIARALSYEADVLILDEAMKGLEPELKKKIGDIICEYAQTKPVIIVTHDEYEASLVEYSVTLG